MNKPRDDYTELLAETLADDWANGPTAGFARRAAAKARNRRRRRIAASVAGSAAVLAMALFVSLRRPPAPPPERAAISQRITAAAKPGYEIISDDELLTQLRDRPVLALKNADGTRELVMLPNE
jgi:hypothetical protein